MGRKKTMIVYHDIKDEAEDFGWKLQIEPDGDGYLLSKGNVTHFAPDLVAVKFFLIGFNEGTI